MQGKGKGMAIIRTALERCRAVCGAALGYAGMRLTDWGFKIVQGDCSVGVDGVVAVQEPVAHVDVGGLVTPGGGDVADEGGVAVAEDAGVDGFLREALAAVEDDACAVVALIVE